MINVSWRYSVAYCAWLANETGQPYRLPSEAEWEYACRAGTTTRFSCGDKISPNQANCSPNIALAIVNALLARGMTKEVGSYPPNPWGLYDMHGNVWEWVEDIWRDNYQGAPSDGTARIDSEGEHSSRVRVIRGGSRISSPRYLRSAKRGRYCPDVRHDVLGFRVARALD